MRRLNQRESFLLQSNPSTLVRRSNTNSLVISISTSITSMSLNSIVLGVNALQRLLLQLLQRSNGLPSRRFCVRLYNPRLKDRSESYSSFVLCQLHLDCSYDEKALSNQHCYRFSAIKACLTIAIERLQITMRFPQANFSFLEFSFLEFSFLEFSFYLSSLLLDFKLWDRERSCTIGQMGGCEVRDYSWIVMTFPTEEEEWLLMLDIMTSRVHAFHKWIDCYSILLFHPKPTVKATWSSSANTNTTFCWRSTWQ